MHGNLVVLDLRDEEIIHPTNRFTIYALFPQCNVSMHVLWGLKQQNTVFAVGKSIIDRSSRTDVGALMLAYGGGGHEAAGTCQVDNERAVAAQQELIARINDRRLGRQRPAEREVLEHAHRVVHGREGGHVGRHPPGLPAVARLLEQRAQGARQLRDGLDAALERDPGARAARPGGRCRAGRRTAAPAPAARRRPSPSASSPSRRGRPSPPRAA